MGVGDDQCPITGQQHLAAPVALEGEGVGQGRRAARSGLPGEGHVMDPVVLDDQDPTAVGLDQVGFVDSHLLDIGA